MNKIKSDPIHIRLQQRNARKTTTTIENIPNEFDLTKFKKVFQREFACNGQIVKTNDGREIIRVTGDQRNKISDFFIKYKIFEKSEFQIHG